MLAKTSVPSHVIGEHLAVAGVLVPNLIPAFYVLLFMLRLSFPSLSQFGHFAECSNPLIWIQDFDKNASEFITWFVLYWVITVSFLNWDSKRWVSYCTLTLLVSSIGLMHWMCWFETIHWKMSDAGARYYMHHDLLDRKLLNGKTKSQVLEMLGKPDNMDIPGVPMSQSCLIYDLWDGSLTKYGEPNPCIMRLQFDKRMRLSSIELRNEYNKVVSEL